jgi:hypothetical protein
MEKQNKVVIIKDDNGFIKYTTVLGSSSHAESKDNINEATHFLNPKEIEKVLNQFSFKNPVLLEVSLKIDKILTRDSMKYELFSKLSNDIEMKNKQKTQEINKGLR